MGLIHMYLVTKEAQKSEARLRACFIQRYADDMWHLKFVDVYEGSLYFDEVEESYPSLRTAQMALNRLQPTFIRFNGQEDGELWG
jgi:hypothetical protein